MLGGGELLSAAARQGMQQCTPTVQAGQMLRENPHPHSPPLKSNSERL